MLGRFAPCSFKCGYESALPLADHAAQGRRNSNAVDPVSAAGSEAEEVRSAVM